MKYLEAKRLAERQAREADEDESETEAKMQATGPENKAVLEGPANKAEEWPLAMPPAMYITLNAGSDNPVVQERVALARRIVEAE